jgi:hypothetical protein
LEKKRTKGYALHPKKAMTSTYSSSETKTMLLKPAVTAAVGMIAGMYFFPAAVGKSTEVAGIAVSAPVLLGGGLYLSSLLGEVLHDKLYPSISRDSKLDSLAGVTSPALVGGAYDLLLNLANASAAADLGNFSVLAVGAISEVAGDYIWHRVLSGLLV